MKFTLSTSLLVLFIIQTGQSQIQYSNDKYQSYTQWFHSHSATNNDRFISFVDEAPVYAQPNSHSKIVAQLFLGEVVTESTSKNPGSESEEINGFREAWLPISICDQAGVYHQAYVWKGHLAKSWQYYDIDQDGKLELLALGTTTHARRSKDDIAAELRIIENRELQSSIQLPGFCLFEDCISQSMLRLLSVGQQLIILEASLLTEGSLSGVDKAFIIWENNDLQLVYQAEFITGHEYLNKPIYYQQNNTINICHYQGENSSFDPIWTCKVLDTTVAVP